MAQILPGESIGGRIGSALGTGLGSGLQNLAEMKMRELSRRNIQQGLLSPALGFSPQDAQALSGLDTTTLNQIVKQQLAKPQQESYAQALSQILGISTPGIQQEVNQSPAVELVPGTGIPTGFEQLQQTQAAQQKQLGVLPSLKGLTEKQVGQLVKISNAERQLLHKQQQATKKEAADLRKEQALAQKDIDKETAPFYQQTLKESKAAQENDMRLERMTQLINAGKLTPSLLASLFNTAQEGIFGPHGPKFDLTAFKNPDSQEFEKLSNDFLKSAKEVFGARLTNFDVQTYLKTVPTLLQTDEGKRRVIQNLKVFNEGVKVRAKTMNDLITQNNGRRPRNLELLVEQKAAPQLDSLAKTFKEGYQTAEVKKPDLITYGQENFPYFRINL